MNEEPNEEDIALAKKAQLLFDGNGLSMNQSAALLAKEIAKYRMELIEMYEEVLTDHRRLVRKLDIIWNEEEGAAKQAALIDVIAQIQDELTPEIRKALQMDRRLRRLKFLAKSK